MRQQKNLQRNWGVRTRLLLLLAGVEFHDALAVSSLAAYNNIPILLAGPKALLESTKDALKFIGSH